MLRIRSLLVYPDSIGTRTQDQYGQDWIDTDWWREKSRTSCRYFGCKLASLPIKYLSLLLGVKFKDVYVWTPIVKRFEARLTGRARNYLSNGEILALLKSTLASISIYYSSLLSILASVLKRLEAIQRCFLWGNLGEERRFHLVARHAVKTSFKDRGPQI